MQAAAAAPGTAEAPKTEEKKSNGFSLPNMPKLPSLPKTPNLISDFVPNAIKVEGNDGFKVIQKFLSR